MFPLGHLGFTLAIHEAVHRHPRLAPLPRLPVMWLAVGAMLPDVVDKPLGHGVLDWGTGRIWGHTLLFVVVLAAVAWGLARRHERAGAAVAALAAGSFAHLVLDQMWVVPEVLLWPLLGPMPHGDFAPSRWLVMLRSDLFIQVTEILGSLGLLWVVREARLRETDAAAAQ